MRERPFICWKFRIEGGWTVKIRLTVLVTLFAFVCFLGWVGRGWAQKTNTNHPVWEYKVGAISILDNTSLQNQLNQLGEEGWDLVAVENVSYTAPPSIVFYLKRGKE
jgi:hypothetical protein